MVMQAAEEEGEGEEEEKHIQPVAQQPTLGKNYASTMFAATTVARIKTGVCNKLLYMLSLIHI